MKCCRSDCQNRLSSGADDGLTPVNGASTKAAVFTMFILSPNGQRILAKHGFAAPGFPKESL